VSKVHYFQRYSQRENVVTNNTLLLFSRLYAYSARRFEAFLADLLEAEAPEIGVRFTQQRASTGGSVPDGLLEQRSFKIIIETKLHSKPEIRQLARHMEGFGAEERQLLLLLTPEQLGYETLNELQTAVRNQNEQRGLRIEASSTTFRQAIQSYRDTLAAHDFKMRELLEDYEDFCATFDKGELLPRGDYTMRAVPCGNTWDDNLSFGVYYEPVNRSPRAHRYLGIYKDKSVQGVGEIVNVVESDLTARGLQVSKHDEDVTPKQRARIEGIVQSVAERSEPSVASGHRFYLVDRFRETDFRKGSPGGLRGPRFLDLGEILGTERLPSVEEIAELLSGKTW
jgi:hypothetical protein